MSKTQRVVAVGTVVVVIGSLVCLVGVNSVQSQPPAEKAAAEPAAPEGQTYTGAKRCSSCHFKQYTHWKKSKHATDAWDKVPAKYRKDPACINCHATGFGKPTGFVDEASTPNLTGNSCEGCHGPGSKHEEVCKPLANKKTLTPDEEKAANDSIYRLLPRNVCADCHIASGHKEHPKYDK